MFTPAYSFLLLSVGGYRYWSWGKAHAYLDLLVGGAFVVVAACRGTLGVGRGTSLGAEDVVARGNFRRRRFLGVYFFLSFYSFTLGVFCCHHGRRLVPLLFTAAEVAVLML